jgi:hypothetical protein
MSICGYHLRCLNNDNKCFSCKYQHEDRAKDQDYLHDVLNIWPQGKEAAGVTESAFSQKSK